MTKDNIFKFINKFLCYNEFEPYWALHKKENGIYKPKWSYDDAVMLKAFLDLYDYTKEKKYLNFCQSFLEYYLDENQPKYFDFEKYNIDNLCMGYTLLKLYKYTNNIKYLNNANFLYNRLKNHPKTKSGSYWHKEIYPNQVWLDGLYMGQPFNAYYNKEIIKSSDYNDIIIQFKNIRKYMFDEKKELYYHGYDESRKIFWANKETGLSKNFWSRSIGWLLMAFIDTIEIINNQYLIDLFKEAIDGLIKYLSKDYLIYQVVDKSEIINNYEETSGSAMFAYSVLKAVRLKILDESYKNYGIKCIISLINKKMIYNINNKEFILHDTCQVAGLGPDNNKRRDGTIEYYLSEPKSDDDPKAVGPFIMAVTEYYR